MEKFVFLTIVAEVMKGIISYDDIMVSIQRSCMRSEAENLELMGAEENRVDEFIKNLSTIEELNIPEDMLDVIVLRYLRNTQYLAKIRHDDIDVSAIEDGDINYWKKAMLYKAKSGLLPKREKSV